MAAGHHKTAIIFRPKRMWKPKWRDRNIRKRKKRKRWWRRNKHRLRHKRNLRRKLMRKNQVFKTWRKRRLKEKARRRWRVAADHGLCPEGNIPEIWFVFPEENELGDVIGTGLGYVCDYSPDTEELLIYDTRTNTYKGVFLDDFFRFAQPVEEADSDNFDLYLDQFYGEPRDDLDIIPEDQEAPPLPEDQEADEREPVVDVRVPAAIVERVASRWLLGNRA